MRNPRQRFASKGSADQQPKTLDPQHKAVTEGRTLFPANVQVPGPQDRVLKSGEHTYKLGSHIVKGRWRGFPIYSLSLEERATCPATCLHWADCYGNRMQWPTAVRWQHGPELIRHLELELDILNMRYQNGFALRLHNIGDFYSVDYVEKWSGWLARFEALHVFGYTHRERGTPIGDAVITLRDARWDRFAIRLSDSDEPTRSANTIYDVPEARRIPMGIVCPAQDHIWTKQTDCCGTCGLCWGSNRNVVFKAH